MIVEWFMALSKNKNEYPTNVWPFLEEEFYIRADEIVKSIDPEEIPNLKSDETIDYFDGLWKQIPMYVNDLVYFSGKIPEFRLFNFWEYNKNTFNSAQYNYIGKDTAIPMHIDKDLTSDIVLGRVFVPLCKTSFIFEGEYLNPDMSKIRGVIYNPPGVHSPAFIINEKELHSFKQLDENGHYMIMDIFRKDAPKECIIHYIYFSLKEYL